MSFSPERLMIARKRRLLNKKQVARRIGVADHTVGRWEAGTSEPTEENVDALARILGYPRSFFDGPVPDEPAPEHVSFRSQSSMSASIRDAALAAGAIGFMVSDWVEARFNLPQVSVPNLDLHEPEAAAVALRQEWGLGERPISNIVHLLESKGVRVFSLSEETLKVNAFSIWRSGKPYVFLNTMKTAESSRFDAAHELGHLVLHQDGSTTGREAEDQANKFASALLMPRADVLAHCSRIYSVDDLVARKLRWRVSVAALAHRLHKVGVLSDWKYRDLYIQIVKRGFNKHEPHEIARERSIVWQKVLRELWSEGTSQLEMAKALSIPVEEVDALIFGVLDVAAPPVSGSAVALRVV